MCFVLFVSHLVVCVCVFVTRESRASKGKDDSPAPLLPLRCCASSSSYLPSSPFPAPRAFWDAAYHPTQFEFLRSVPAKSRQFPSRFPSSFFTHPLTHTHIDIHHLTHTHTHTHTHTDTHQLFVFAFRAIKVKVLLCAFAASQKPPLPAPV